MLGCCVVACWVLAPTAVFAQAARGRFEVGLGVRWTGATAFAPVGAAETTPGGAPFALFTSSSRIQSSAGVEGRLGVRLMPAVRIEVASSYARPELSTSVSNDFEGAASTNVTETLTQLRVEGSVLVNAARWHIGARAVPFVAAGAGYLRELHEGDTLVETGQSYFAGGGLNYFLNGRPDARAGAVGLRVDARASIRHGAVTLDQKTHLAPSLGASLFVRF